MRNFLLCLLLTLSWSQTAFADNWDEAKQLFQKAEEHYSYQDYTTAIEFYAAAYRTYQDPAFLFNLAQCYRLVGDVTNAIELYESYLQNAKEIPDRESVEQAVSLLKKTPAPMPSKPLPSLQAIVGADFQLSQDFSQEKPVAKTKKITSYWWFWSLVGGGALIATGGTAAFFLSGPGVPDTALGHQDAFQE